MIIILFYILSWILLKFSVWIDSKYELFKNEDDEYNVWIESIEGRKKIFIIIWLIPLINIISIPISIVYLVSWIYLRGRFKIF